jgi:hypothetical protein
LLRLVWVVKIKNAVISHTGMPGIIFKDWTEIWGAVDGEEEAGEVCDGVGEEEEIRRDCRDNI